MVKCLILGLAGVGKSSVIEELLKRGRQAYDIDTVPNLAGWFNKRGVLSEYQDNIDWRANHEFLWNYSAIQHFLNIAAQGRALYIAGIAGNALDIARLNLFNKLVFLDASAITIVKRLKNPDRQTPYPFECTPEHEAWLHKLVPQFTYDMLSMAALRIDAESNIAEIVDTLINHCEN